MKKWLFLVVSALSFGLLSCSKSDPDPSLPGDKGCSELKVVPVSGHDLSSADVQTANGLFARNSLDTKSFRYTRYSKEMVQTYFPPYASFESQAVGVQEYANGLPIFTGVSNFIFKNGVFDFRAGKPSNAARLSASSTLRANQLRSLFIASNAKFDNGNIGANSQCMEAEFGYYDLNASTSYAPENMVKAWRVNAKNQAYPLAYYQDQDGRLIYYDNCIRTFR